MGRWKDRGDGQPYYDPNDSGPDQIAAPRATDYTLSTDDPDAPGVNDPGSESGGGPSPYIQGNVNYDPNLDPKDAYKAVNNVSAPATPPVQDRRKEIAAAYQKYLGRGASEADYMSWAGNDSFESGISGSPEATAYAAGQKYTPTYNPMPGWVTDKLNNPSAASSKYEWGRVVQQHPDWLRPGGLEQLVQFYNLQTGGKAKVAGYDKVDFGDGNGPIDVIFASHGENPSALWSPVGTGGGVGTTNAAGGAGGSGGTGGGVGGDGSPGAGGNGFNLQNFMNSTLSGGANSGNSSSSNSSGSFAGNPFSPQSDELWSMLMARAKQGLGIDRKDPVIANQVNAFGATQERANRKYLAQLAESGGPGKNLTSERRMLSENAGQATGGLQAQLITQELTARRGEIQNALTQAGSMLSDEQRISLQNQVSSMDAMLRMYQMRQQNNQFLDQLGLNATDSASHWDAVRSGLLG